MNVNYCYQY